MTTIPNLPESVSHSALHEKAVKPDQSSLRDIPIDGARPLRVIVIGAGFSGINCGIRIPQRLRHVNLTVYEKNADVGGTWYENRYPGCACDVPASGYEIEDDLRNVAWRFSAARFIKCNHSVKACEWDELSLKWRVQVEDQINSRLLEDEADVIISARGTLNDYNVPLEGKTIGVIDAGSSAMQIIPQLQALPSAQLKGFIRSKTCILPPFGAQSMEKLGMDEVNIPQEQQDRFERHQEEYHAFRKRIEQDGNGVHSITHKSSGAQNHLRRPCQLTMTDALAGRPDIAEAVIPRFAVGCRRLTPGIGFLEALNMPNVEFVGTHIAKVVPSGIVLEDQRNIQLDVLVCATGFNAAHAPPFPVKGSQGRDMADSFKPYPKSYLSMTMHGFPNYFMILGPNSLIGTGSLSMRLESQTDYIVKCIRKMQRDNIASMDVKADRVEQFSQYIDKYFKQTVCLDGCTSWYLNEAGKGSRVIGLWPGSCLHAMEAYRAPRWEDFDFVHSKDEDGRVFKELSWLGNSYTHAQRFGDGDLAWYLETEFLDVPSEPLPEKKKANTLRTFCY
ncbi:hypothetical protein PSV09DRAFT_2370520 [Bipolaris maydis]|nr:hypothetical protein J3E74DRAFT_432276 [Bipolaris maydis]KAJ6211796.1 hypothetical protein PSV09DRAFT_2370520 [Bipolaris maydis]